MSPHPCPTRSPRTGIGPLPIALILSSSLFAGCDRSDQVVFPPTPVAQTADFDSEVATRWLDRLYHTIRAESFSPPAASRVIGYAGVALYESVVPGIEGGRSLAGQLNGLNVLPAAPEGEIHWPSAANAAFAAVLNGLFPTASDASVEAIATLEAELGDAYRADAGEEVADRSVDFGHAIANAILGWAATDGYTQWNNCTYVPPSGPGMWVPTPPAFAPPLQPCWGRLRPFALLFSSECSPLPHPAYSTEAGSAFCNEVVEVYETVNNLTAEQLAIAQFWADGPGATGTPPGHWISILEQICVQEELDLAVAAEGAAKVGIAVADAFISCWELKYHYNLLRPISYIRDPTCPINDPAWTSAPGVGTPPFPEYTSGHSVQSGAAAFVLEDLLGALAFVDDTHDYVDNRPARSFTSFTEAAAEAAISRLYGGIHYRAAIERGVEQGRCIGATLLQNVSFHGSPAPHAGG